MTAEYKRRKTFRRRARTPCLIMTHGQDIPGTLIDYSAQGVGIEVENPDLVPETFILFENSGTPMRKCKLINRSDRSIGAIYLD